MMMTNYDQSFSLDGVKCPVMILVDHVIHGTLVIGLLVMMIWFLQGLKPFLSYLHKS